MAKRVTTTSTSSSSKTQSKSTTNSQSQSRSESVSSKFLDTKLRDEILAGLMSTMTDAQIEAYAESLLRPQLNAGLEAAQHEYDTAALARQQEIENIAEGLKRAVAAQRAAYGQSIADVQTGALARGMGRSSYALQTMANQGSALAQSIRSLTDESARQSAQIQRQITLADQQRAAKQNRLNQDYAASLAAKVQELRREQQKEYNTNYLTAVSGSLGQRTTGSQQTQSSAQTRSTGTSSSSGYSVTTTR